MEYYSDAVNHYEENGMEEMEDLSDPYMRHHARAKDTSRNSRHERKDYTMHGDEYNSPYESSHGQRSSRGHRSGHHSSHGHGGRGSHRSGQGSRNPYF
eukprot:NODE_7077_length_474_cov_26.268235_g6262_i0.p2 GENE.NODE_7077_length_474_cov_26.268235_g6262_i0~~NODE_7077_length_474_cov_26.268235_g6262_i0.p2  ORF type:complete len:111 (+),score=34.49 NODE_7077_length_474_cov_26.268235_g6262_i0:41-334(+)